MGGIKTKDLAVPREKFDQWQNIVDILAEVMEVNNAAITKVEPPELELLLVSQNEEAAIEAGERMKLAGLFCEEVIATDEKLMVANALQDKRWQNKPGLETGLISYLGFSLKWPDGDFFGTICVHDTEEMNYSEKWIKLMSQFQTLIESQLEIIYKNQQLSNSLDQGFQLQQRLLPSKLPEIERISLASYYQPALKLGGDFYNFIELDNLLVVYIADVAGHGLDGALINVFLRETINNFLLAGSQDESSLSPKKLIQFIVRRYKEEDFPKDQLISLLVGVLDLEQMEFTFSNAGIQIPPLVINRAGEISTLVCKGVPISTVIDTEIYSALEEKEISFTAGETVLLTTDGLIEERVAGSIYGIERVKDTLRDNYCFPPAVINYRIREDFEEFADSKTGQDDLTYLTLRNTLPVIAEYEAAIDSSPEEIWELKQGVVDFLQPYCSHQIKLWLGLQEIICNAVEHGNQLAPDKKASIKIQITEDYIKFAVADEGAGFDWRAKLEQDCCLLSVAERGRGIDIACQAYDQVWYNEAGNKAFLLKLRPTTDC